MICSFMVWHFIRQFKQSKRAVRNCAATHSVKVLEYITVVHNTLLLRTDFKLNRPGWNISFIPCWMHVHPLTTEA